MVIDHLNENKLDYRLENLQLVTQEENIKRCINNHPEDEIFLKFKLENCYLRKKN